jgi:hypothetical protein
MRLSSLAFVLFAACGGSSSTTTTPTTRASDPTPAGATPVLLGRPIWDGPLTDPMALRALDRVRMAVADNAPVLEGGDPRSWLGPVQGWIEGRVKLTREVRADADALASDPDPRMQLLASVVFGVAADDFISDLVSLEPPKDFATGDLAAETRAVFHEALEKQATQLTATARAGLQKCIAAAPNAPAPLHVWEAFCRERDASLKDLETRVAARSSLPPPAPVPKPPAMFSDCDTKEVRHVDPEAPPADMKAKPAVAYIYVSSDVKGEDVPKLEQAVAAKLGLEVGMPVVDDKEMAAARKLVAQKKLHAKAPSCGQAPPLPAVIAHKRRHLIIGEIQTTCIWHDQTERCGLLVEYTRAGSDEHTGLPRAQFARTASRDLPAADWIASADRLVPDEGAANILGSLSRGKDSPIFFDLANFRDDDPWLRVASTLDDDTRERLAACVDAPASFDATFTISPVGKTQKAVLAPVTAPPPDSKVTECVKKALEATGWPCPLDGKPAKVAVRMCVAPRPQ